MKAISRIKNVLKEIKNSFKVKGFLPTVKIYKKQMFLILGIFLCIIGIIALTVTGVRLHTSRASDSDNIIIDVSDMTYLPKQIDFELNKSVGEKIKDTHGDIVINSIGDASSLSDTSFVKDGDNIYVHYNFTFNFDNEFDGEIPNVTGVGIAGDTITTLTANNVVKTDNGWTTLDKQSIESDTTYDAYASFDVSKYDTFYFQFMNADGNITILRVA